MRPMQGNIKGRGEEHVTLGKKKIQPEVSGVPQTTENLNMPLR
jgi:hypothetical protein